MFTHILQVLMVPYTAIHQLTLGNMYLDRSKVLEVVDVVQDVQDQICNKCHYLQCKLVYL